MEPPKDERFSPTRTDLGGPRGTQLPGTIGPPRPRSRLTRPTILRRDASPTDVARILRATLGLVPDEPAPGELAASIRRSLPAQVEALDLGAWLAWCLAGLPLFGGAFPELREIRSEATRVTMALAM